MLKKNILKIQQKCIHLNKLSTNIIENKTSFGFTFTLIDFTWAQKLKLSIFDEFGTFSRQWQPSMKL